jgi:hypothetical protein
MRTIDLVVLDMDGTTVHAAGQAPDAMATGAGHSRRAQHWIRSPDDMMQEDACGF